MVLTLLCCAVFAMSINASAAAPSYVKLGGTVTLNDGYYLKEGSTTPTTTKPSSGGYAYYKDGVLQLSNFDVVSTDTTNGIYTSSGDLIIELVGASTIKSAQKGIYTRGALTVRGSGSLTVTATENDYGAYIQGKCTIEGGTLNITATGANADAVYVDETYTQKAGSVTLKSATRCFVTYGVTYLQGGSLTLDGCDTGSYSAWHSYEDIYITAGDLTITSAGTGISSDVDDVIISGSAEIKIDVDGHGIRCKSVSISDVEQLLISAGSSSKAFYVNSLYLGTGLACSGSQSNDGNNAYALTSSNFGLAKYAYIRNWIDLYVGGIPMGIGEYLHQSWGAASTYKPSDNYARVDLNGDTDELYLKNFNLDTTNNKITSTAISTSSSLKLYLDGTNYIKSGTGDAICINKGSLVVISGGTLNINTTSGIGINLKTGDYIHGGNAIINITSTNGTGVNLLNQNLTVNSGELNVTAKYDGIHCVNFTITGGKVDTRSTNTQNNKGLSYTTLSYGSLTAKAAATADGALVNLTSAHKTANKRVVIASHICTGQKVAAVEAGCTSAGKRAYYKCSCGKFYEDAACTKAISNLSTWGNIRPTDHTPIAGWKSDGTYHWKTCTKCSITEIPNTKVKHSGGEATCRAKAMCDVCKVYYGEIGNHKWSNTWDFANTVGHTHFCVNDGCNFSSGYEAHVPDIAAPTESQAQKCKLCNYVIAPALGHVCKSHVYKVDYHGATCIDYGNIEYYECTCGKYYKDKNATQEITDKSSVRIPKADHEYLDNWYSDANGHWQQCDCLKKGNEATHKDDNADYVCDVCSYKLPEPATTPTNPSDPTDPTTPTNPSDPTDPTNPTDPTEPVDPTTQPTTGNPGGDTSTTPAPTTPAGDGDGSSDGGSNLWWLWIVIAVVAIGGIVFFVVLLARKKEQNQN